MVAAVALPQTTCAIMNPILIYIFTVYVAIFSYLGLAVHVLTRSSRRALSWAFAGFMLCLAGYYLTGLFLFPPSGGLAPEPPLALRIKWAVICLAPAFFYHFMQFYFGERLQRRLSPLVPVFYVTGLLLAAISLFSSALLSGVAMRGPQDILGPDFGPGIWLFFGYFLLVVLLVAGGLAYNLRTARSHVLRRQLRGLLAPFVLLIVAAGLNWVIVLTGNYRLIPHEIGDGLLILSGFLYASVIVQYGSITGRPMAIRHLFYAMLMVLGGLGLLMLGLIADLYLQGFVPGPLPIITSIMLTILVAGYPVLIDRFYAFLERIFAPEHERVQAAQLNLPMQDFGDPELLRDELLAALTNELQVSGVFVAEVVDAPWNPDVDLEENDGHQPGVGGTSRALQVLAAFGHVPISTGQRLPLPAIFTRSVTPVSALSPIELERHAWYGLLAYCRLSGAMMPDAMLAICSLEAGEPLTARQQSVVETYCRQIEIIQQLIHLDQQRQRSLQAATSQQEAIRELEERIQLLATSGVPRPAEPSGPQPELSLSLLGQLQVAVSGQQVPDSAWESERARELLAYLLWKGSAGATTHELAESLWPEKDGAPDTNALYVTVNRLRRVLEPDLDKARESQFILSDGRRYRFNFNAHHWLDVDEFIRMSASNDANDLRRAVDLYRGAYLEDSAWNLPTDVEAYRRTLEHLYLECLRRLVARQEGRSDDHYLLRLLAVEPLDEEATLELGERYLARGRSDLAFELLTQYHANLEEVDAEPSEAIRNLWRRIQRGFQDQIP
jgi:DNA-binding SARP family transcriptional activator